MQVNFKCDKEVSLIQFLTRGLQSPELDVRLKLTLLYTVYTRTVPEDHEYQLRFLEQEKVMASFHRMDFYRNVDCC